MFMLSLTCIYHFRAPPKINLHLYSRVISWYIHHSHSWFLPIGTHQLRMIPTRGCVSMLRSKHHIARSVGLMHVYNIPPLIHKLLLLKSVCHSIHSGRASAHIFLPSVGKIMLMMFLLIGKRIVVGGWVTTRLPMCTGLDIQDFLGGVGGGGGAILISTGLYLHQETCLVTRPVSSLHNWLRASRQLCSKLMHAHLNSTGACVCDPPVPEP